jgi:hypothetical protein
MDLNEARKVVWIGSNRRPLGELLDIGYLNKERLTWAVEHVNNPRVHQAAAVLLDWLTQSPQRSTPRKKAAEEAGQKTLPGLELRISLEKAREVLWPFSPYKGEPMGPLVESRKLTLHNLSYAIDNAWDSKVRDAAISLMALRLSQIVREPEPSKGHLHVFTKGRKFSEKRQLSLAYLQGGILGTVLGGSIIILINNLLNQHAKTPLVPFRVVFTYPIIVNSIILFIILCIIGVCLFFISIQLLMKAVDKKIENYRVGQEGEDRIVEKCMVSFTSEWSLFRNVILPGSRGDLDAVLVGPTGVWLFEIKTLSGQFKNAGEQWSCLIGNQWKPMEKSPGKQARKNAIRLKEFFEANNLKPWVNAVVVWANPDSPLEIDIPSVAVWKMNQLEDELGNIQEGSKIPENDRQRICEKLTRLIEKTKK